MSEDLDTSVGFVLKEIEKLGIENNTYINDIMEKIYLKKES